MGIESQPIIPEQTNFTGTDAANELKTAQGSELPQTLGQGLDFETVAAAGNIIGPPPVATPEEIAAAQEQVQGMFEAPAPKPVESVYDPNLDESNRRVSIRIINDAQEPIK